MTTTVRVRVLAALLIGGTWFSTTPTAIAGAPGICGAYGCLVLGTLSPSETSGAATDEVYYVDGYWYVNNQVVLKFGGAGYQPLLGDWDGDGYDEPGLFIDGVWIMRQHWQTSPNGAVSVALLGGAQSKPVVGNWDKSAADSIGVFDDGVFTLLADPADPLSTIVIDFGYLPPNPGLVANPLPFAGPIMQGEALVGVVYGVHVMVATKNDSATYDFHAHEAGGGLYGAMAAPAHPFLSPVVIDASVASPNDYDGYALAFRLAPHPDLDEQDACGENFICYHNPDRPDDSGSSVMPEPNPY